MIIHVIHVLIVEKREEFGCCKVQSPCTSVMVEAVKKNGQKSLKMPSNGVFIVVGEILGWPDRDGVGGTRSRIIGARCGMRIGQNRERIYRSEVRIAIMGSDRGHGSDRDMAITSRVWS